MISRERIRRERIRNEIREELAKHKPVETARMALELLAETSIRFVEEDGSAGYQVLNQNGQPRAKIVDGKSVDLTIPDLVAELRDRHSTLFQPAIDAGLPKVGPTLDVGQPAEAEAARPFAAGAEKTAAKTPRDELMLGPSGPQASPAAEARSSGTVAEAAEPDRDAPAEPMPTPGEPTLALLAAEPRRRSGAPADQAPTGIGRAASGAGRPRRRVLYGVLAGAAAVLLIGVWGFKTGLHPSMNSPAARSEEASAAPAVAPVSDVHPVEALAQERKRAEALARDLDAARAEIAALKPLAAAQQSLIQERQRAQILEKLVQELKKSEVFIRNKTEALARDLDAARAETAVLKSRAQRAD